ncbi:uncharacterized protein RCC_00230 [Ramularia collo-cygni]|uniref:Uncharacterized protein n=1 Tax=Ramularia collo-cygni TaxID=112498 RepID=A0A2D3UNV2_9PEZI|nr:uncharacterized protein RCC_00230 [Ramularia collo-cygni]CZT14255.1 uncharacterized protein RCC_00230 [Ramularia collo-cygni]
MIGTPPRSGLQESGEPMSCDLQHLFDTCDRQSLCRSGLNESDSQIILMLDTLSEMRRCRLRNSVAYLEDRGDREDLKRMPLSGASGARNRTARVSYRSL